MRSGCNRFGQLQCGPLSRCSVAECAACAQYDIDDDNCKVRNSRTLSEARAAAAQISQSIARAHACSCAAHTRASFARPRAADRSHQPWPAERLRTRTGIAIAPVPVRRPRTRSCQLLLLYAPAGPPQAASAHSSEWSVDMFEEVRTTRLCARSPSSRVRDREVHVYTYT